MWYQYRCYPPVILLKIYIIFVAFVFSAGGGRSARHPWPTASHPTALATSRTEKTDMETGRLTRWVHLLWYFNLVSYIIHQNIYWPAKKKCDILQGTVSRDWQWKMW